MPLEAQSFSRLVTCASDLEKEFNACNVTTFLRRLLPVEGALGNTLPLTVELVFVESWLSPAITGSETVDVCRENTLLLDE